MERLPRESSRFPRRSLLRQGGDGDVAQESSRLPRRSLLRQSGDGEVAQGVQQVPQEESTPAGP
jgi:hypothetical protein